MSGAGAKPDVVMTAPAPGGSTTGGVGRKQSDAVARGVRDLGIQAGRGRDRREQSVAGGIGEIGQTDTVRAAGGLDACPPARGPATGTGPIPGMGRRAVTVKRVTGG